MDSCDVYVCYFFSFKFLKVNTGKTGQQLSNLTLTYQGLFLRGTYIPSLCPFKLTKEEKGNKKSVLVPLSYQELGFCSATGRAKSSQPVAARQGQIFVLSLLRSDNRSIMRQHSLTTFCLSRTIQDGHKSIFRVAILFDLKGDMSCWFRWSTGP